MRLNYNDAIQVDIIHTDMAENAIAGLGIFAPIGDMDFYPNGGKLQVIRIFPCFNQLIKYTFL